MASQLSEPWNRRVDVRRSNCGREHAVDKFGSLAPCFGIDGVKVENCRIVVGKGREKQVDVNVQATASVTPLIRAYPKSKFVSSIGEGIEGEQLIEV
jgi:hypothetical protein